VEPRCTAGGSLALVELIDRHGREVERELADKGIDLRDVYLPGGGPSRLTPRRVLALVEHPREGNPLWAAKAAETPPATDAEPGPPSWHGWTFDRHLLAGIFDVLQFANYQRNHGKGPAPKPVIRPTTAARRTTGRDYMRSGMGRARRVAGR
jgi:hypothetical protein